MPDLRALRMRRADVVLQGYRIELAPTAEQRDRLAQHAGLSRVVENFCLELVQAALRQRKAEQSYGVPEEGLTPVPWSASLLERAWRVAHPLRFPWVTALGLSTRVPKEACRLRAAGLMNWVASRNGKRRGRRVGFPTWRKRKDGARFRVDAGKNSYLASAREVQLPRIGRVATREDMSWLLSRIVDGGARHLSTVVKERGGRWWVSFQIEVDRTEINKRRRVAGDAPTCGVDLGLKTFAVVADDSDNVEEVQAPRALKAAQRKLRKASKALHRRVPGSVNRAKARQAVAAIHLKVAHRRSDFLHKLTTRLARTKRAIAVENLHVAAMVRNRRLSRHVADAGFGEFIRQLTYKANWYGSKIWTADRWFPSSKTCGDCGAVNAGLTLSDRSWACPCGAVHDRDHNAARNLLAAMHAAT